MNPLVNEGCVRTFKSPLSAASGGKGVSKVAFFTHIPIFESFG